MSLRDNYYDNIYAALGVTARRRLWLMIIGALLLLALMVLVFLSGGLHNTGRADTTNGLELDWLPVAMVLLGALGSVISAVQRLTKYPVTGAIPASLGSFTAALSRPLIGAVAAYSVYLAAWGGLARPQGQGTVPLLLLAGLTAGVTERLVTYDEQGSRADHIPSRG